MILKYSGTEQQKIREWKKKKSTIEKQVMHSGKISGKIESVVFQQSYLEYVLHICIHGLSRKKKKKKKGPFIHQKYYHSVCVIYASVWNPSDSKTDSCVVYNVRIWN